MPNILQLKKNFTANFPALKLFSVIQFILLQSRECSILITCTFAMCLMYFFPFPLHSWLVFITQSHIMVSYIVFSVSLISLQLFLTPKSYSYFKEYLKFYFHKNIFLATPSDTSLDCVFWHLAMEYLILLEKSFMCILCPPQAAGSSWTGTVLQALTIMSYS